MHVIEYKNTNKIAFLNKSAHAFRTKYCTLTTLSVKPEETDGLEGLDSQ